MIRYVRIGDQIRDAADDFAFFDTVRDRFVCVDETSLFGSVEDLVRAWGDAERGATFDRLISLIPAERR